MLQAITFSFEPRDGRQRQCLLLGQFLDPGQGIRILGPQGLEQLPVSTLGLGQGSDAFLGFTLLFAKCLEQRLRTRPFRSHGQQLFIAAVPVRFKASDHGLQRLATGRGQPRRFGLRDDLGLRRGQCRVQRFRTGHAFVQLPLQIGGLSLRGLAPIRHLGQRRSQTGDLGIGGIPSRRGTGQLATQTFGLGRRRLARRFRLGQLRGQAGGIRLRRLASLGHGRQSSGQAGNFLIPGLAGGSHRR